MAAAGVPTAAAFSITDAAAVDAALAATGAPVRGQGRRSRRRQGRGRHRRSGRRPGARAGRAGRRTPGARRELPVRTGGLAVRGLRRQPGRPAAAGPGLQAGRRRRRRTEHRRDGRLRAAAVGAGRPRRHRAGHRAGPGDRRDGPPRHARSAGCCTPAWCSPRPVRRSSSSTAASAIPRRRSSSSCCDTPLAGLLAAAATGDLSAYADLAWRDRLGGDRGGRGGELPGPAGDRGRHHRRRRRRRAARRHRDRRHRRGGLGRRPGAVGARHRGRPGRRESAGLRTALARRRCGGRTTAPTSRWPRRRGGSRSRRRELVRAGSHAAVPRDARVGGRRAPGRGRAAGVQPVGRAAVDAGAGAGPPGHAGRAGHRGARLHRDARHPARCDRPSPQHYADWYGLAVDPDEVVVTTGSSGAFTLAFLAAFDPGARVGMAVPCYPAYRNILQALGCEVVPIRTGTGNPLPADGRADRGPGPGRPGGGQPGQPDRHHAQRRRAGGAGRRTARRTTSGWCPTRSTTASPTASRAPAPGRPRGAAW